MSILRHPALILTAHGSADPRSAETTHAVAGQIRRLRPWLDVRVAFCERSEPNLRNVLAGLDRPGVVTPLLLASAYHARIDIPGMIDEAKVPVLQADTLGEDPRLIEVLRARLDEIAVDRQCDETGVLVVAVGSTHAAANARTATVVEALAPGTRWAGVRVAHATNPELSVSDGIAELRRLGARRVVLAPWFIAHGRITDRVAALAAAADVSMTEPLGAHPLLAATVLDRFDRAVENAVAAHRAA
ncbi:MAG: sirohydrochlorin chelatase [Mycobacterium sp.]